MRIRQLGALADADLGVANQHLDALAARIGSLADTLNAADRASIEVPAALSDHITIGLWDEYNALNSSIDSISHAELPHWLAQAQALATEMSGYESQLALVTGSSVTHTATVLVVGAIAALVIAAGLAFFVKKKGGMRGLAR